MKALSASYSDLLYQVQIAGRRGLLYVLFEHQSTPDDVMPLRLLGYLVRILELEVRTRDDAREDVLPLPVVLPVVLHHSAQGWKRAVQFTELFDSELLAEPEMARLVPHFEFVLDDLSRLTDDALRRRALDQVSSLTLWALRDARTPARLLRTVRNWVATMQQLLEAPSGLEAFQVIFRYIALVAQEPVAEQVLKIVLSEAKAAEEPMTTLAEKWIAEGVARGREEGIARGREEACQSVLRQLLALKFGALELEVSERIALASEPELIAWTTRVLSASSIDEVFAS